MRALLAAFVWLTAPALAAEPLRCPPHIQLTPQVAITPPAGFTARALPEYHWLTGADLFDGNPDERVQLKPDRIGQTDRWDLDPARAHTLACLYEGTDMTLTAALPLGTRRCTAATRAENSRGVRGHRVVTDRKVTEVVCQ
jgi:hypothetical protein